MWSNTVSKVPEDCLVVAGGIVLLKQVFEVAIEVAPYGVDVVGVVLRVVELDQERGRLDAVIARGRRG